MAEVVGLSGPQGGGKTSLLNELARIVPEDVWIGDTARWVVDDFKVSREVQSRLGWRTLERVRDDPNTMMAFQRTVLEVKHDRDRANGARTDVDVVLTERTFADIAAYAQLWAWELAHDGKWTVGEAIRFNLEFVEECAHEQYAYAANLYLPYMDHVPWQEDPHRASRAHVTFIDDQIRAFLKAKNPASVTVHEIVEKTVEVRAREALIFLTCDTDITGGPQEDSAPLDGEEGA